MGKRKKIYRQRVFFHFGRWGEGNKHHFHLDFLTPTKREAIKLLKQKHPKAVVTSVLTYAR